MNTKCGKWSVFLLFKHSACNLSNDDLHPAHRYYSLIFIINIYIIIFRFRCIIDALIFLLINTYTYTFSYISTLYDLCAD